MTREGKLNEHNEKNGGGGGERHIVKSSCILTLTTIITRYSVVLHMWSYTPLACAIPVSHVGQIDHDLDHLAIDPHLPL